MGGALSDMVKRALPCRHRKPHRTTIFVAVARDALNLIQPEGRFLQTPERRMWFARYAQICR
jgi:hypothetical protein